MAQVSVEEEHIKDLLKQAVLELFQERKDLFYDLFAEVVEDFAMVNAIKEGEGSGMVSKLSEYRLM
jgi:hypothetical protein